MRPQRERGRSARTRDAGAWPAVPPLRQRGPGRIRLILTLLPLATSAYAGEGSITVDTSHLGATIPKSLYGVFLEEINNAGEGGLYAEMVQNRGFEDANTPPACKIDNGFLIPPRTDHFWENRPVDWKMAWPYTGSHPFWSVGGDAVISVVTDRPLTPASPHALKVDVRSRARVLNDGYWGMAVRKGDSYNLSLYARTESAGRPIVAALIGADGATLARSTVGVAGLGRWKKLTARLEATRTDSKAKLALVLAKGTTWLDFVSLFPAKTFMNRPNGLRPDLAKMITDLKPAFVRYPGGCYVEGVTVQTRPQWRQTIGPMEGRTQTFHPWGYWNTNGFGYHEWLQFCEDVHADGLYVFNVGVSCAFRSGTFLPDDQLPALIHDTLDAIEYAVGPTTSKWGAVRAKNGHPKPFPLKYVEIGNEQSGPRYGQRVAMFRKAIKAKYPQMKVILSSWISGIDHAAIDAAGPIDIVDEHAYTGAYWAISHFDHFARYPRNVPWELYIGEFACNGNVERGNMLATLNDAATMMDMEKNADLVKMGSYAPLLENVNRREWDVNLIHFDGARAFGRASYYACKLFAENRPDVNLSARVSYRQALSGAIAGPIGLGTYGTAAEFKDVRLEQDGKVVYQSDFTKPDPGWHVRNGDWGVVDGAYRQSSEGWDCWTFFGGGYRDATLTAKARKLHGGEGFVVSVGDAEGRRVQFNVGGWGNRQNTIEADGLVTGVSGQVQTGRWYDLKVVVAGRRITAFVDGEQVLDTTLPRIDGVLAIAGLDRSSNDVVVKVLNPGAEPATLNLDIPGTDGGTITQLAAKRLTDENSFEEPTKIVPKKLLLSGRRHTFAPYSLSIVRMSRRRAAGAPR